MAITGAVDLGLGVLSLTVDHDPTATATDAPKGSLVIDANGIHYIKEDDGLTTNVSKQAVSFSVGSVVFVGTNGLTEDNANLFWDNTNNRLGIGTTSPQATLEVGGIPGTSVGGFPSGNLHVTGQSALVNANAVITGHNLFGGNKQLWYLGSASGSNDNITVINRQNASLSFGTNSTTRFTIEAGGNVVLENQIRVKGGTPGSGKVLTSDAVGLATWESPTASSAPLFGINTVTQSFTSDTTLADVTGLSVALEANKNYHVKVLLFLSTGAGGIKAALNGPAGFTSLHYMVQTVKTSGIGNAGLQTAYDAATGESSGNLISLEIHGTIINGGTAGNLVARAAQNSSNVASSDILRDSFIRVEEIT